MTSFHQKYFWSEFAKKVFWTAPPSILFGENSSFGSNIILHKFHLGPMLWNWNSTEPKILDPPLVESIDLSDLTHWYPLVHESNEIVCLSWYCFKSRWYDFDHFLTISDTNTLNLDYMVNVLEMYIWTNQENEERRNILTIPREENVWKKYFYRNNKNDYWANIIYSMSKWIFKWANWIIYWDFNFNTEQISN